MAMVCLFICEQYHAKSVQAIFMKPCKITDYCYGKNPLNSGVGPTQNGRKVAILDFYYLLSSKFTGGTCSLQAVRMDDVQYASGEC